MFFFIFQEGNRFNLSQGAVFYRVYARPPGSSFVPKAPKKKHSESTRKFSSMSFRSPAQLQCDMTLQETFRSQDIEDDWVSSVGSLVIPDASQFDQNDLSECGPVHSQCYSAVCSSEELFIQRPLTSIVSDEIKHKDISSESIRIKEIDQLRSTTGEPPSVLKEEIKAAISYDKLFVHDSSFFVES